MFYRKNNKNVYQYLGNKWVSDSCTKIEKEKRILNKCKRESCNFLENILTTNNNEGYCCRGCIKEPGLHGPLCNKSVFSVI